MSPTCRRVLLVSLVIPVLMGSKAKDWREVAEGDLAFARDLAAEGVRFDAAYREKTIEGRVSVCQPRPSKIRGLGSKDLQRLERYCLQYCAPWAQTWREIWLSCQDRIWTPKWCENDRDLTEHIGLASYFETLTGAILASENPLQRTNIMEIVGDRLNSEFLRPHPTEPLDKDFRILDWRVNRARAFGIRVRVDTLMNLKYRKGPQKGQVWSREWDVYWVFEDETWNQGLGVVPEEWSDEQATEVHLAEVPPVTAARRGRTGSLRSQRQVPGACRAGVFL